tara:strand:+ start:661 stop:855 length:195 start_codon:yes stop_codon:yes gene_type:complete
MTPTPKLRFVERPINICTSPDGTVSHGTMVRILQQWWEPERNIIDMVAGKTQGKWRDVPLEEET